jgi:methionyl-tRNA formyltransferase
MMRIVFFGSPDAALPSFKKLLEAGHRIELVVTQPDRPSGRGKKLQPPPVKRFALDRGFPVLQPERIRHDAAALEALRRAAADIHVVVAFGQILPEAVIDLPPYKSVNVHFSLLPKYRGAAPVAWALLNGDAETGVTIFRLNAKMDEGDILSAESTPIRPDETAGNLEARLAEIGADLLAETLARIAALTPIPQDNSRATLAPKIKKEDGRLAWTDSAGQIGRKARAFTPRPGAFVLYQGRRLLILRGRPLPTGCPGPEPGTIAGISKAGLDVACGDGSVFRIERLQPESRKAMDAYAFSLGERITLGTILS